MKRTSITHCEMTDKTDDNIMVHAEEKVLTSFKLASDTCRKGKNLEDTKFSAVVK